MSLLERLEVAGFPDAAIVGLPMCDKLTVRVRTDKGWLYEKFDHDEDVSAWASRVASPK